MFDFYVTLNIDESKINQLLQGQGIIMSALQDLKAELEQTQADLVDATTKADAERAEVQGALNELKAQSAEHIELIKQLQEQIANGGGVTEADLFEAVNSAKAVRQGVKDLSERVQQISEGDVVTEPTEPTPEEPTA